MGRVNHPPFIPGKGYSRFLVNLEHRSPTAKQSKCLVEVAERGWWKDTLQGCIEKITCNICKAKRQRLASDQRMLVNLMFFLN